MSPTEWNVLLQRAQLHRFGLGPPPAAALDEDASGNADPSLNGHAVDLPPGGASDLSAHSLLLQSLVGAGASSSVAGASAAARAALAPEWLKLLAARTAAAAGRVVLPPLLSAPAALTSNAAAAAGKPAAAPVVDTQRVLARASEALLSPATAALMHVSALHRHTEASAAVLPPATCPSACRGGRVPPWEALVDPTQWPGGFPNIVAAPMPVRAPPPPTRAGSSTSASPQTASRHSSAGALGPTPPPAPALLPPPNALPLPPPPPLSATALAQAAPISAVSPPPLPPPLTPGVTGGHGSESGLSCSYLVSIPEGAETIESARSGATRTPSGNAASVAGPGGCSPTGSATTDRGPALLTSSMPQQPQHLPPTPPATTTATVQHGPPPAAAGTPLTLSALLLAPGANISAAAPFTPVGASGPDGQQQLALTAGATGATGATEASTRLRRRTSAVLLEADDDEGDGEGSTAVPAAAGGGSTHVSDESV